MADILVSINVPQDPNFYNCYGEGLITSGFEAQKSAVNGAGLLTRGLVWQASYIWCDAQAAANLLTGWTAAVGYSGSATIYLTGWTASIGYSGNATLFATGWTASAGYVGSATVYATGWTAAIGYAGSTATYTTGWTASQVGNAVTWGEAPE